MRNLKVDPRRPPVVYAEYRKQMYGFVPESKLKDLLLAHLGYQLLKSVGNAKVLTVLGVRFTYERHYGGIPV